MSLIISRQTPEGNVKLAPSAIYSLSNYHWVQLLRGRKCKIQHCLRFCSVSNFAWCNFFTENVKISTVCNLFEVQFPRIKLWQSFAELAERSIWQSFAEIDLVIVCTFFTFCEFCVIFWKNTSSCPNFFLDFSTLVTPISVNVSLL